MRHSPIFLRTRSSISGAASDLRSIPLALQPGLIKGHNYRTARSTPSSRPPRPTRICTPDGSRNTTLRSSMPTTVRRPRRSPMPMICPPSTVANRRSLETRIAVALGTASLSSGGMGARGAAGPPGPGVWTAAVACAERPGAETGLESASGLSVGTVGVFSADGVPRPGATLGGGRGSRPGDRGLFPGLSILGSRTSTFGAGTGALTTGAFAAGAGGVTTGGFESGVDGGAFGPAAGRGSGTEDRGSFPGCPIFGSRTSILGAGAAALAAAVFVTGGGGATTEGVEGVAAGGVVFGTAAARGSGTEDRGSFPGCPIFGSRTSILGAGAAGLAAAVFVTAGGGTTTGGFSAVAAGGVVFGTAAA